MYIVNCIGISLPIYSLQNGGELPVGNKKMVHIDSNNVLLYNDVINTLTIVLTVVSIAGDFHLSSTM